MRGKGTRQQFDDLGEQLWPAIKSNLGAYQPDYLAIMGEDPGNTVAVHFFDWLTETYVEEERPGFKIVDRAVFASPECDATEP
jgi:hypothetical protein